MATVESLTLTGGLQGYHGRTIITLPGPSTTHVARALGSYDAYVVPHLRALVARGLVIVERVGVHKTYRPVAASAWQEAANG